MLRTLSQPDLVELTMMMESMMDEGTRIDWFGYLEQKFFFGT